MYKNQTGYTLIELLVALLLGTVLVLGISSGYSAISGVIQTSKNIENAQEVLRYSAEVFTRSLKQTAADPTSNGAILSSTSQAVLTVAQSANTITCDGYGRSFDYTETYSLDNHRLKCEVTDSSGAGSGAQTILSGIESITYSRSGNLISVLVQPQAQQGETLGVGAAMAVKIDIALSSIIITNATGA